MSTNAYLDAKAQYMNLLKNKLGDVVYDIFKNMYTTATTIKGGETLVAFQTMVKDVQNWNMTQIQQAVTMVEENAGPRFVSQCLKAIFYLNAKILSGYESKREDIQIRIPPVKDFLYNVVLESAKSLYRHPSVFGSTEPEQMEHNMEIVYSQIFKAIDKAVEKSFPYENFLEVYDKTESNYEMVDLPELPTENEAAEEKDREDEADEEDDEQEERRINMGGASVVGKPILHSDAEDDESDTD